jgi:hypothetical protein
VSNHKENGYREALKDDVSLALFLRRMGDFDRAFCKAMNEGLDYTLKIEVHGNSGRLIHCRVSDDSFDRPGVMQLPSCKLPKD